MPVEHLCGSCGFTASQVQVVLRVLEFLSFDVAIHEAFLMPNRIGLQSQRQTENSQLSQRHYAQIKKLPSHFANASRDCCKTRSSISASILDKVVHTGPHAATAICLHPPRQS